MSARATVAGLDGRAVPFPIYVTAGDALLGLGAFIRPAPPMTEDQAEETP